MISMPRRKIVTPRHHQRGIICATAVFGALPGAGDTIDLVNVFCTDEAEGTSAFADIRAYSASGGARAGEVWYSTDTVYFKANDFVEPNSNADDYQMKWESLSGDDPNNNTVASGVWHPLSTSRFDIAWDWSGGDGGYAGDVTVSIRKGTGPTVLDTAVWDGSAQATPKEKDK